MTTINLDAENIQTIQKLRDGLNFDSVNTPALARLLNALDPTLYSVLRADTSFTKLMTINTTTVSDGAEFYTYGVSDYQGAGKVIEGRTPHKDLPFTNATLAEKKAPLEVFGNGYYYTYDELRQAAFQSMNGIAFPIDQERRKSTLKSHELRWNTVALLGSTEKNTKGLFNNTNIPSDAVASDGTGSSPLWSTKTGQLIVRDITNRIIKVRTDSLGVHNPNTLALTPKAYGQLQSTAFASSESKSALQYFKEAHPEITNIVLVPELTGAFSSADGFIVYENKPENISFYVGRGYTETPVQSMGLHFEIYASSKYVAEPIIRYPKAFAIGTGI